MRPTVTKRDDGKYDVTLTFEGVSPEEVITFLTGSGGTSPQNPAPANGPSPAKRVYRFKADKGAAKAFLDAVAESGAAGILVKELAGKFGLKDPRALRTHILSAKRVAGRHLKVAVTSEGTRYTYSGEAVPAST